MKFVKVDDTTIRCLISESEMEGYGIEIEEFLSDRQKASEFLQMILDDAREETGFTINEASLSVEATMLPGKGLSLTISENTYSDDIIEKIRRITDAMKDYLSFDDDEVGYEVIEEEREFSKNLVIYTADTLSDVITMAKALTVGGIKSTLYKLENPVCYILVLEKDFTDDELRMVGSLGLEFAGQMLRDELIKRYVNEHGICMYKDTAVEFLRAL